MKKRLRLKKKVWFFIAIIIFIPIFIVAGIKIKAKYDYQKTYEYRFLQKDYTKKEYELISKYFEKSSYEEILAKDKDETLLKILANTNFIKDNLERYLDYSSKNNLTIDDIILDVNLNLDYKFYENITETDTEKDKLMLVNKYNALSSDYEPNDLVVISQKYSWGEGKQIRKEVYDAFLNMWDDANNEGIYLIINLGYRSYADQEAIYNRLMKLKNRKYADGISARPGHSEHQTGLALDIFEKNNSSTETFKDSIAYTWLKNNAYKYGFILRYTEENESITGFNAEDWHYRYVGKEVAKKIYESNITFEEYYTYNVK